MKILIHSSTVLNDLRHKFSKPRAPIREQIHIIKSEVPSALHKGLANGKNASNHGHTLIEQIYEASAICFSDTFATMTKQGDMQ